MSKYTERQLVQERLECLRALVFLVGDGRERRCGSRCVPRCVPRDPLPDPSVTSVTATSRHPGQLLGNGGEHRPAGVVRPTRQGQLQTCLGSRWLLRLAQPFAAPTSRFLFGKVFFVKK